VGAGPAGLLAAKKLEAKGNKVVVFEKRQEVGGKCQAVYDQWVSLLTPKVEFEMGLE
jgi:flavin-dependent dehydrogenase